MDSVVHTTTKSVINKYFTTNVGSNAEKFVVIDTETNWNDEVMSIGVVIAEANSFNICELKYYIITPEYLVGGQYSHALKMNWDWECDVIECSRMQAIQDLLLCLQKNEVEKIFAYCAAFDYRHLPELHTFIWYDIMRLAAYRQYNHKIKDEDCCSTGRLKCNYSVESIKKLLTGLVGEEHNALCDALDELNCIMKPLGYKIDDYIPYNPCKSNPIKSKSKKEIRQLKLDILDTNTKHSIDIAQLKLTIQDFNDRYSILQPKNSDLIGAFKNLTKKKNALIILEHTPTLNYIKYIKVIKYDDNNVYIYCQYDDKQNNRTYNYRKKLPLDKLLIFLIDFRNGKMPNINEFEILD